MAEAVDENIAIIARQAIVDENRAVFGYELFDRSTASDAHTAASDSTSAGVRSEPVGLLGLTASTARTRGDHARSTLARSIDHLPWYSRS